MTNNIINDISKIFLTKDGRLNSNLFKDTNETYIKYYKLLKELTPFLDNDAKFPERFYCVKNNITNITCPTCKQNKLKFLNFLKGYQKGCSISCSMQGNKRQENLKGKHRIQTKQGLFYAEEVTLNQVLELTKFPEKYKIIQEKYDLDVYTLYQWIRNDKEVKECLCGCGKECETQYIKGHSARILNKGKKIGSLELYIEKYGKEEGTKLYEKNVYNKTNKGKLENLVKEYGEDIGKQKFKEMTSKQGEQNTLQYKIDKYGEEEGKKRHRENTIRKGINSKQFFIDKYGEEIGSKKYEEIYEKKKNFGIVNRQKAFERILLENIYIPLFNKDDLNILKKFKFKCIKCNKEFESESLYLVTCECYKKIVAKTQYEIYNFIKDHYTKDVKYNKRFDGEDEFGKICKREIDIYLPDLKIGFEYDGFYRHCSNNEKLKPTYHRDKTRFFNRLGITIFHIFEDEWKQKKDIVKSMILSKIGYKFKKIHAKNKNCVIKEVSYQESLEFLNNNHIQGGDNSKYRLGIFYKNELVSLMTFLLGESIRSKGIILSRFASKIGYSVIEGFSTLLKKSCLKYNFKEDIDSFADLRWVNPDKNVYILNGFTVLENNDIDYYYVIRENRFKKDNFKKINIEQKVKKGDLSFYDEDLSEFENMKINGIYHIYDCGKIKYRYKIK